MKNIQTNCNSSKFYVLFLILFLFGISLSQPMLAQETDTTDSRQTQEEKIRESWNRFDVYFGGFFAGYNSGLSVGSEQLGAGIQVDLEDALGLNTSGWVLRGGADFYFGKTRRHTISAGYFDINRSATKTLEDSIQLGGIWYPVGEKVSTKFDLTIIRAKYGYAFLHDERISLSVSGGLFILPISFSIAATGLDEQAGKITAPLPVVGLSLDVKLSNKFYLSQSTELLYLASSNFDGGILDINVQLGYRALNHVAFGLAVNSTQIEVEAKTTSSPDDGFIGYAGMSYTGVAIFAAYYF